MKKIGKFLSTRWIAATKTETLTHTLAGDVVIAVVAFALGAWAF